MPMLPLFLVAANSPRRRIVALDNFMSDQPLSGIFAVSLEPACGGTQTEIVTPLIHVLHVQLAIEAVNVVRPY